MPITEKELPDITLASTTESQAELDHATGPNWRQHFDPAKAKTEEEAAKTTKTGESSEKKDETKTAPASEPGKTANTTGAKEEEDDLPPGARKRIDKLTARLRTTEEQLETLRKNAGGKTETKSEPAKAAPTDPEPLVKDFKDWNEWNAAHNRWIVRDEQRKLDAKAAETEAQQAAQAVYDAHIERLETARTTHEDFDDAIKAMPVFEFSGPAANQAFQMAVVEADNGPEIMYHLAKNPEEMAKFADLSPVKVQMLVGQLSAKLSPASSSTSVRTKPVSRTPAPTTPVRGGGAAPTALDDPNLVKNTDAWIEQRQRQLSARRR